MRSVVTGLVETLVRDAVRPAEPVASLYLGTPPDVNGHRLHELLRDLARHGADQATVAALAAGVDHAETAAFAAGGELLLRQPIPGAGVDLAAFAAPARVVPLLAWRQARPGYVAVVIDRTGADVTAVPHGTATGTTAVVEGPDDEIERNAPGGWSQPRYQRRAVDSWQHNAGRVAEAVAEEIRRVRADLLVVAGDVRAVQLLCRQLPTWVRHEVTVRHVGGGRAEDGSRADRLAATARVVAEHAATRTGALLARFTEACSPDGHGVAGVRATLRALAEARVGTLLIAPRPLDPRVAWFGPEATDVAVRRRPGLRSGALLDVAVRAALLTDAEVVVLDPATAGTPVDGIGALCRYH